MSYQWAVDGERWEDDYVEAGEFHDWNHSTDVLNRQFDLEGNFFYGSKMLNNRWVGKESNT